jgi:hypothetical protein
VGGARSEGRGATLSKDETSVSGMPASCSESDRKEGGEGGGGEESI